MKVLGLDIGTSSVKAAVLDTDSSGENKSDRSMSLKVTRVSYPLDQPTPDTAEIAPEHLWKAILKAARTVVKEYHQSQGGRPAQSIEGIGLSSLTPALVLLDRADKPLGSFWTHLDRRSRPAALAIWEEVGDDFLQSTGNRPLPGGISAVCFRQQMTDAPQRRDSICRYLHLNGWVGLRLTGETAFDPANASFSGLYETLKGHRWSSRWCEYFQVDPAWLPEVRSGTVTLGGLRRKVAEQIGLPEGIPVKLGTADTSSAMLAVGMRRGDLLHVVGTTQVLAVIVEPPIIPDPRRLTRQLGVGDSHVQVTHNPVGGAALGWLHDLCFTRQSARKFYGSTLTEALRRVEASSSNELLAGGVVLDPPFLGGDRLELEDCRAAYRNLALSTTRMDLLVAMLGQMRQQHQVAVKALGQGAQFARIILTGGGADVARRLMPGYQEADILVLEEGSLRGVARLWDAESSG